MNDIDIVTPNMGIIARLAYQYWQRLPLHVKASLDLEDVIADTVLRVCKVSWKYSPKKAKSSTFVWTVARNYCRGILVYQQHAKRKTNGVVPYTDLIHNTRPCGTIRFLEAKEAVEWVIADASDDLRRILTRFIENRRQVKWPPSLLQELQRLTARHGATRDDFRAIFMKV